MTDRTLQSLRSEIDLLDAEMVRLLEKRFAVTRQIGQLKARGGLPLVDASREIAQQQRYESLAMASGISPSVVTGIFRLVIDEVVREHRAA